MKFIKFFLFFLLFIACASNQITEVKSVSKAKIKKKRWSSEDSKHITSQIITEILSRIWISDWSLKSGNPPRVFFCDFPETDKNGVNLADLKRIMLTELKSKDKVKLSNKKIPPIYQKKILRNLPSSIESYRNAKIAELNADFLLYGTFDVTSTFLGEQKIEEFTINMKIVEIKTNETVCQLSKTIKKILPQN